MFNPAGVPFTGKTSISSMGVFACIVKFGVGRMGWSSDLLTEQHIYCNQLSFST